MAVTDLEDVKLYCKIDFDFEDKMLEEMIDAAEDEICFAIGNDVTPQKIKAEKLKN